MREAHNAGQTRGTDIVGLVISISALVCVAMFPAIWWFASARRLMRWRLFDSAVPFSTVFGILVLIAPLLLVWRFVRRNDLSGGGK